MSPVRIATFDIQLTINKAYAILLDTNLKNKHMFSVFIINPLPILLSLSTMFGVLVHDTKVDQFTTSLIAAPAIIATYDGVNNALKLGDAHTHTERVMVSQLTRSLAIENPRLQPRGNDDKKYVLQKNVARGHHPFDNYNLPVIA